MDKSVTVEIEIKAAPERVFAAWIDPKEMIKWWGDEEYYQMTSCRMEPFVGGRWSASGVFHKSESRLEILGEIRAIDAPTLLRFTWHQSWLEGVVTYVEFTLRPNAEGTLLAVKHSGDPTDELAESHRTGWELVFSWMRAYLEGPAAR